jgi:hypothetical protein
MLQYRDTRAAWFTAGRLQPAHYIWAPRSNDFFIMADSKGIKLGGGGKVFSFVFLL